MTIIIGDIASYQGNLTLDQLWASGYHGVNIKLSHGLGVKSVHPRAPSIAAQARAENWQLSSFHWLTGDDTGTAQADHAYAQLVFRGLEHDVAVVVDVEDATVTAAHYQDYCVRMAYLLGRPIITYTGDWYAASRPWLKASTESPWLWAVPNAGSMPYPGDDSAHWVAGYGGWEDLAAMQYSVPTVAGVRVSTTAVRSLWAWSLMKGAEMAWRVAPALNTLNDEINKAAPNRDKASDGTIGDAAHSASVSDHNPDAREIVHARDWDEDLRVPGLSMEMICQLLLRKARAGDLPWLKYVIYERRIWAASSGWVQQSYSGANAHDKHMHVSCKSGTLHENDTRPIGIASLLEEDVALTPAEEDRIATKTAAKVLAAKADIAKAVWDHPLDIDVSAAGTNNQPAGGILRYADNRAGRSDTLVKAVAASVKAMDAREAAEIPVGAEPMRVLLGDVLREVLAESDPVELDSADVADKVLSRLSERLSTQ